MTDKTLDQIKASPADLQAYNIFSTQILAAIDETLARQDMNCETDALVNEIALFAVNRFNAKKTKPQRTQEQLDDMASPIPAKQLADEVEQLKKQLVKAKESSR